jgi:hypothetical protein
VIAQFALPPYVEGQIADRLTEHGGEADVSISAFPAVRLLFDEGTSFQLRARALNLDITRPPTGVLEKLDGFGSVDMDISASSAGPISVRRFALARDGPDPYRLRLLASVSLPDLARFGAGQLGGALAALFAGGIASQSLPKDLQKPLVIDQDVRFTSDGGRLVVVSGEGTVGGVPTEPVIELITQAIVLRL